jgi:hypothetical protein
MWTAFATQLPVMRVTQRWAVVHAQARARGGETAAAVLLKAYQPPEELAACREGDLFVVHNLADKCASMTKAASHASH